jgi:hemolysin III
VTGQTKASGPSHLENAVEVFEEIKPRLRGWLHTNAAIVSLASGATLISVSSALKGIEAGIATAIYSLTVTLLFGGSALYHRYNWSPRAHQVMKRVDHSMIFVFIAGSYTPIAALALHSATSVVVLITVWTGALAGVVLQSGWPDAPRWVSVPCYIALGWVAVFVGPQLLDSAGVAVLVLIAAGGVVYTIGGVVYGLKRPDPAPAVFGFHEVFHLCTLVAATCHYIAIWLIVFD